MSVRPLCCFQSLFVALLLFSARASGAERAFAPHLVVARDGSGDFTSVHAAVQSLSATSRERRIVFVKNGVYAEKVRIDAPGVTLRGESRASTRIEFAQGAEEFRAQPDPLGQAVLNLAATAHDCVIENLTVRNTHGVPGRHAFAIFGLADRTVILDCDVLSEGNDTLSLWRGRAENAAAVDAAPTDASGNVWREAGRYYHARLNVRGSVDFICPRGWCFMRDSTITQANPGATAAIWHDGSNNADKKFVLRNCSFDGPPNWYLARRHHDAHFYLLDCTFSKTMRDQPPYRVVYPLGGGTPSEADRKRNADYDRTNVFGERAYFFNSHRDGGDYAWHRDNLAAAPGAPKPGQITPAWTFAGSWDPERTDAPRVIGFRHQAQPDRLHVTFSEPVTVKGSPRLVYPGGERAEFLGGSGTARLEFASLHAAFTDALPKLDLNGGAIVACEAGATLRFADVELRVP